jgi:hypothetical protein
VADDKKGFLLRLSPQLFEELRRWADQEMRSINGQLEWLVRDALQKRLGRDPDAPPPPKKKR